MKLAAAFSLAILAVAGPAGAWGDDRCPPGSHPSPVTDHDTWRNSQDVQIDRPGFPNLTLPSERTKQLKIAMPEMHLACAADREALCADKTSQIAADRCVAYHILKVSKPCRESLERLEMAYDGRL